MKGMKSQVMGGIRRLLHNVWCPLPSVALTAVGSSVCPVHEVGSE